MTPQELLGLYTTYDLSVAVNKLPRKPNALGRYVKRSKSATTMIPVVLSEGKLTLVEDTPRGTIGTPSVDKDEKAVVMHAAHLTQPGRITADDVQNKTSFGSNELKTVQEAYLDKLQGKRDNIEATLEYHVLGAIRGYVMDASGSVLYDLYELFGQEAPAEVTVTIPSTAGGSTLQRQFMEVGAGVRNAMGGTPIQALGAVVGEEFWLELLNNPEVADAYRNWAAVHASQFGREDFLEQPFYYGGIVWHRYDYAVGGNVLVESDKAHIFPIAQNVLQQVFAPADYVDTVNQPGLEFYARQWMPDNGKSIEFEVQSNPCTFCTYPEALRTLKLA